jgi:hypothetical protein
MNNVLHPAKGNRNFKHNNVLSNCMAVFILFVGTVLQRVNAFENLLIPLQLLTLTPCPSPRALGEGYIQLWGFRPHSPV